SLYQTSFRAVTKSATPPTPIPKWLAAGLKHDVVANFYRQGGLSTFNHQASIISKICRVRAAVIQSIVVDLHCPAPDRARVRDVSHVNAAIVPGVSILRRRPDAN